MAKTLPPTFQTSAPPHWTTWVTEGKRGAEAVVVVQRHLRPLIRLWTGSGRGFGRHDGGLRPEIQPVGAGRDQHGRTVENVAEQDTSRPAGPAVPSGSRASAAARHRQDRSPWPPASSIASRSSAERDLAIAEQLLEPLQLDLDDACPCPARRSRWNRMISSTRLRNSGRNDARTTPITWSRTWSTSSSSPQVDEILRAEVRGHDDQRVAEIDRAALAVGQAAVVEHLQQHVEHVRMRLLDLVEQHDLIGPPAHRLGQRAAFVVADIARRRADQPRRRSASP